MPEELKTCPFCGTKPVFSEPVEGCGNYRVDCSCCGVYQAFTKADAVIRAWNRRAESVPDASLSAALETARKALQSWKRFAAECEQRKVKVSLWAAALNELAFTDTSTALAALDAATTKSATKI